MFSVKGLLPGRSRREKRAKSLVPGSESDLAAKLTMRSVRSSDLDRSKLNVPDTRERRTSWAAFQHLFVKGKAPVSPSTQLTVPSSVWSSSVSAYSAPGVCHDHGSSISPSTTPAVSRQTSQYTAPRTELTRLDGSTIYAPSIHQVTDNERSVKEEDDQRGPAQISCSCPPTRRGDIAVDMPQHTVVMATEHDDDNESILLPTKGYEALRSPQRTRRHLGVAVQSLIRRVLRSTGADRRAGEFPRLEHEFESADVVLGSGTGGSVRLYRRKTDQTLVAVKFFRRDNAHVRQELALAQTLPPHPHLLETIGVYRPSRTTRANALALPVTEAVGDAVHIGPNTGARAPNVPVLVTKYYPEDLFTIIERTGGISTKQRDRIFAQLVYAVAHLHRHGLAHRDLKLENACLDSQGALRLVDLGSAAPSRDRNGKVILSTKLHGSDPYMAPEALLMSARKERVVRHDHNENALLGYDPFLADSWSLGVIYLCLTRRCFHWERADAKRDPGFRYFVLRREQFLSTFTPHERVILEALLAQDPTQRWLPEDLLVRLPWLRKYVSKTPNPDMTNHVLSEEEAVAFTQPYRDAQGHLDLDRLLGYTPSFSTKGSTILPMHLESCVW